MKEAISAAGAPAAIGPYSHAVKAGNLLFLSGQVGIDPATGGLPANDMGDASSLKAKGTAMRVRFRPEDAHFVGSEKTDNAFGVRILMSTFEGGCFRIKACDRDGEELTFLNDSSVSEGTEGYMEVPADKLYVYDPQ